MKKKRLVAPSPSALAKMNPQKAYKKVNTNVSMKNIKIKQYFGAGDVGNDIRLEARSPFLKRFA